MARGTGHIRCDAHGYVDDFSGLGSIVLAQHNLGKSKLGHTIDTRARLIRSVICLPK